MHSVIAIRARCQQQWLIPGKENIFACRSPVLISSVACKYFAAAIGMTAGT